MNSYHDLATAMRKGAALRPQTFGSMFTFDFDLLEPIDSCALGALYEGATGSTDHGTFEGVEWACRPAIQSCTRYPSSEVWGYLPDIITHLNDQQHWTREQIADWLDSL